MQKLWGAFIVVAAAAADYQLAPEDLLEITLYNVPERQAGATPRTTQVQVSQEGRITLPLLGEVPAAGLTPAALTQALHERYARYLRSLLSSGRGPRPQSHLLPNKAYGL